MSTREAPEELVLEAWRFTNERALVREVCALLDASDYHVAVEATPSVIERLAGELEDRVLLGRLRLIEL
jgi:hypothetical protein